jgi:lipopolysaccharide/colanic/teichoic acid biosynthesis glycosyltransferase
MQLTRRKKGINEVLRNQETLAEKFIVFETNTLNSISREFVRQSYLIRLIDIVLAIVGICFAFIPMLFIAVAIKFNSKGPVLFIQERLGQYKRPLKLIKFRTMDVDAEKSGPTWAQENDIRVTRIGRFLRRMRLDELPQLFNILIGNLSFIGPRPIRKYFADLLLQYNIEYDNRFLVKPGLSGWAQIFAPYGSTIEEQLAKLPYDLRYLKGLSVKDYLTIILLTIKTVFMGSGV